MAKVQTSTAGLQSGTVWPAAPGERPTPSRTSQSAREEVPAQVAASARTSIYLVIRQGDRAPQRLDAVALQGLARLGRYGCTGRVLDGGRRGDVQTPSLAVLERPQPRAPGSPVPDVLAALWHRAFLSLRQTPDGATDRPDARLGRSHELGVDRDLRVHPTAAGPHAGDGPAAPLGPQVTARFTVADTRPGASGLGCIFARVGYTGPASQTQRKIARARTGIPSPASPEVSSHLQEAKTTVCRLCVGPTPVDCEGSTGSDSPEPVWHSKVQK